MECALCPRRCHALRTETERGGFCGMGSVMRVARVAPHLWEEPCISGTRGSGTVFFAGCGLRCAYCQNWSLSHEGQGRPMQPRELARQIRLLEGTGVHNISFVTASHFAVPVLQTLALYRPALPVVWNTGGYESEDILDLLRGHVDVYLPDLKHFSPRLSGLLCGAEDYFRVASAAILRMAEQTGECRLNEEGIMTRGILIRHLVLPGCTADSMRVLRWIAENLPAWVPVSIMRQYTPISQCTMPGLDRPLREEEYRRVTDTALDLGLRIYTQEKESSDSKYIPVFNTDDSFM